MARYQTWAAACLFVLGLLGILEARNLILGDLGRPGPGFFPFYLALVLSLISLALILRSLRPAASEQQVGPKRLRTEKVVVTLVALILYAFALEWLGFLFSTFALMLFLFKAVDPLTWPAAIGGSLATSLLSYVVFKIWLQVALPIGLFGL